ncbi:hypothetical protein G7K_5294-t1 [Saitoella complicata NRRL Y-17804]|uniref:Uncharacterized protein n=1 Tax=Saitoella complicata (strain BCRC 22490 / CBS 7301 / JCM 7358 / NBRC 10748 / NRRL Y-17804) TaxID=698492 RepID=A0A0E9NN05_SAICN|nr:hypothetical protein G7K_5294-t1 [Saitoella complicata NRRL Y-17804]
MNERMDESLVKPTGMDKAGRLYRGRRAPSLLHCRLFVLMRVATAAKFGPLRIRSEVRRFQSMSRITDQKSFLTRNACFLVSSFHIRPPTSLTTVLW